MERNAPQQLARLEREPAAEQEHERREEPVHEPVAALKGNVAPGAVGPAAEADLEIRLARGDDAGAEPGDGDQGPERERAARIGRHGRETTASAATRPATGPSGRR